MKTPRLLKALVTFMLCACTASLAIAAGLPATVQIENKQYGDLLRPENASKKDGASIVLYPEQPWKCLTWDVVASGDAVRLKNRFTSKTFAQEASPAAAAEPRILQIAWTEDAKPAGSWKIETASDSTHKILDAATGLALTARKTGGRIIVVLAPWKDTPDQHWIVRAAPANLTM